MFNSAVVATFPPAFPSTAALQIQRLSKLCGCKLQNSPVQIHRSSVRNELTSGPLGNIKQA